jgi:hypothetical protein
MTIKKSEIPPLSKSQYSKLEKDIKNLIQKGIDNPAKENSNSLIKTYWQIGNRINQEQLSHKSGYNNSILKDLSSSLEIERTTLSRSLSFYQTYQSPPTNHNLSWSHYRHLVSIKDDTLRAKLEQQAQS